MINNQDTAASKRLKAMGNVLEILEKNVNLQQKLKDKLQTDIVKILSYKFEACALHRNIVCMAQIPFFSKPSHSIKATIVIDRSPVMRGC